MYIKRLITSEDISNTKDITCYIKNHVSSTNDYINFKYVRDQCPILILTNNQRHPRGRAGKKWSSYQFYSASFSLCVNIKKKIKESTGLSHLVAVSIVDACKSLGIKNLKIKWPNDIYVDDKKACGILIENKFIESNSFFSIIGIGINVSIPKNLLDIIDGNPGNITKTMIDVNELISQISYILIDNLTRYQKEGLSNFIEKWNGHMFARNRNIELTNKNKKIFGKAIGIDELGNLLVEKDSKIVAVSDTNYSMRISA